MNTTVKIALSFVGGAGIGAGVCYKIMKKRFTLQLNEEVDKFIDDFMAHNASDKIEQVENEGKSDENESEDDEKDEDHRQESDNGPIYSCVDDARQSVFARKGEYFDPTVTKQHVESYNHMLERAGYCDETMSKDEINKEIDKIEEFDEEELGMLIRKDDGAHNRIYMITPMEHAIAGNEYEEKDIFYNPQNGDLILDGEVIDIPDDFIPEDLIYEYKDCPEGTMIRNEHFKVDYNLYYESFIR